MLALKRSRCRSWRWRDEPPQSCCAPRSPAGAVSVVEFTAPPRWDGPFLHTHDFDEAWYLLEGELVFQLGDEVVTKRAGDFVFAPRGVPHTLANHSDAPAKYVLVITPAGFERYFARMTDDPARVGAAADPGRDPGRPADSVGRMKRGIFIAPFDELSEPGIVADLAARAEGRGWDGFFLWDHVAYRAPVTALADPWITMAAVAMRTERIVTGPLVTPLPRRRIHQLARETVTLDRLSGGRLVLGVGVGSERTGEFDPARFGEEGDMKARAKLLDDGLEQLAGLLGRRVRAAAAGPDPDLGRGALAEPAAAAARRAPRRRVPDRPTRP